MNMSNSMLLSSIHIRSGRGHVQSRTNLVLGFSCWNSLFLFVNIIDRIYVLLAVYFFALYFLGSWIRTVMDASMCLFLARFIYNF